MFFPLKILDKFAPAYYFLKGILLFPLPIKGHYNNTIHTWAWGSSSIVSVAVAAENGGLEVRLLIKHIPCKVRRGDAWLSLHGLWSDAATFAGAAVTNAHGRPTSNFTGNFEVIDFTSHMDEDTSRQVFIYVDLCNSILFMMLTGLSLTPSFLLFSYCCFISIVILVGEGGDGDSQSNPKLKFFLSVIDHTFFVSCRENL